MTIKDWITVRMRMVKRWIDTQADRDELEQMSERELQDIGINRGDFDRIGDPRYNKDLMQRGRQM